MNKKDIATLKKKLGAKNLVEISFSPYPSEEDNVDGPYAVVLSADEAEYDSLHLNHLEKVCTLDDSTRCLRAIKEAIPTADNVFVYYLRLTTFHTQTAMIEEGGWTAVDDCCGPVYDCRCTYIVPVPKDFSIEDLDRKEFSNIVFLA